MSIRGEQLMAGDKISGISAFSRIRLSTLPTSEWRERRARNRAAFFAALGELPGTEIMDAPFAAILVFDEADERERLHRRHLITERIYPSVLWPLERPVVEGIPPAHVELWADALDACDLRYAPADMQRTAEALLGAVNA